MKLKPLNLKLIKTLNNGELKNVVGGVATGSCCGA